MSLVWLAAAAAMAASPLAGDYDGGQTEMAARLRLLPDGRFQYALSYGALDEVAKGRWAERDGRVLLTTDPAPRPPRLVVVSDVAEKGGQVFATLADSEQLVGPSLTLAVTYADADTPVFVEAEEDGRVPLDPARQAVTIVPDLPGLPVPLAPHRLTPGGHRIAFRFEPNDLGVAGFAEEPLALEGGELLLERYDRLIRFKRN